MGRSDPHRIDTPSALRARIGEPNPATRQKVFDRLDAQMTAFLARSPLCLLSTRDADGTLEVSPKGDRPGFTLAENEKTLLIPDRKGNKLLFGLQNILANPQVGLIFLLPGTDETLRVSGRAELRTDPDLPHRCRSGRPRRRRASERGHSSGQIARPVGRTRRAQVADWGVRSGCVGRVAMVSRRTAR